LWHIENIYVVQNIVDGKTFLDFAQNSLASILQPFDGTNPQSVVAMENALQLIEGWSQPTLNQVSNHFNNWLLKWLETY